MALPKSTDSSIYGPGWKHPDRYELLASEVVLHLITESEGELDHFGLFGLYLVWDTSLIKSVLKILEMKESPAFFVDRFSHDSSKWSLFSAVLDYADTPLKTRKVLKTLTNSLHKIREYLEATPKSALEKNLTILGEALGLTKLEIKLLLLGALSSHLRKFAIILDDFGSSSLETQKFLSIALGCDPIDVEALLSPDSRLSVLGLFDPDDLGYDTLEDLMSIVRLPPLYRLTKDTLDREVLFSLFAKKSEPAKLEHKDFTYVTETPMLVEALKTAVKTKERGINFLFWGKPGTGKTEYVKMLAKEAGCNLVEVASSNRKGDEQIASSDRFKSLKIGQAFTAESGDAIFVFDEAEDVFPVESNFFFSAQKESHGKAWVNSVLEKASSPTIWISNSISQIDPAYLRRFQYILEFPSPPQSVRKDILSKYAVGLELSDKFIATLASRKVTPAQVESAVKFARLALNAGNAEDLILKQLNAADKAIGTKPDTSFRPVHTTYDLSLLNIDSQRPITEIEAALSKRAGTLCFYGAPGTGKTALGEYLAKSLGKPLIIKKVSDLMSKWVGETEQLMAAMFEEATREEAILLLDEADSFLSSRASARNSWEKTQVNEMLQQMERFTGIFICTTNLIDDIDEAALRRFTFKIKFKCLSTEQRERMFAVEVLEPGELITPLHQDRLRKLGKLTAGDFATVKRQSYMLGLKLSAEEFLTQLEMEHKGKPELRFEKKLGFS